MSLASTLLSELENMGAFREAGPALVSSPIPVTVPQDEPQASGSGAYKVQSEARKNAKTSYAVMERIVERLDSFSQTFQDLRDDFLELRKLWEPVEEIEPTISLSSPGDGFDESEFDRDNDLNTDDEETRDVEIR